MLVRGSIRIVPLAASILIFLLLGLWFYNDKLPDLPAEGSKWAKNAWSQHKGNSGFFTPSQASLSAAWNNKGIITDEIKKSHHIIYSKSTPDGKYFNITFADHEAINPSILPHPDYNDTWIIVAQLQRSTPKSIWFAELVCSATFKPDGSLACTKSPVTLPIAATPGTNCVDELTFFRFNLGPHDARVFFGPTVPYAMYGSNSKYTCFGMWMSDFRMLMDWGFEPYNNADFREPTELRRPPPYSKVEKNFFVFWDAAGKMYAHYDIAPKRVFAELNFDGSAGPDIAPLAADSDSKCLSKYLPPLPPDRPESIHQATNSLSVTLCSRSDPECTPSDSNTYIMTIIQHKSYYSFHSVYEPYAVLFQRRAPFELYSMSTKPFWVYGRGIAGEGKIPHNPDDKAPSVKHPEWNQTEMIYVTSMSWKTHGQKYHGFIDDVLFIGVGIEDSWTGGIDVLAGDLLKDMGLCSSASTMS